MERDYIDTIRHLMRLTREGKIVWSVEESEAGESLSLISLYLPTYIGTYEELDFILEDHRHDSTPAPKSLLNDDMVYPAWVGTTGKYRLVIHDNADGSNIVSPPLEAVGDLVAFIESSQSPSSTEKLADINRRLQAAP